MKPSVNKFAAVELRIRDNQNSTIFIKCPVFQTMIARTKVKGSTMLPPKLDNRLCDMTGVYATYTHAIGVIAHSTRGGRRSH